MEDILFKDEKVIIRHARPEDEGAVIDFFREHYFAPNHVFTRVPEVLHLYHYWGGVFTFIIGEGEQSGRIYGICGYVPCSEGPGADIQTDTFQTIKSPNPMLGIDMVAALPELTGCRSVSSVGIVPKTRPIYDFLGYETGMLDHYYILGDTEEFKIASIAHRPETAELSYDTSIKTIGTFEELSEIYDFSRNRGFVPYKSPDYIKTRYFANTGYDYIILALIKDGGCRGFFVGRDIEINGAKMMKLVDYIGDGEAIAGCGGALRDLVCGGGYEFIDIYCRGLDGDSMKKAGFALLDKKDENIIPHYYEPFEQRNINILYFTTMGENFRTFRADAGQDRPNLLDIAPKA